VKLRMYTMALTTIRFSWWANVYVDGAVVRLTVPGY